MDDFSTEKVLVVGRERLLGFYFDPRAFFPTVDMAIERLLAGANDSRNGWEGPSEPLR